MTPTAVDSSVIVAALMARHARHREAAKALNTLLEREALVLPAHALLESFSVLTRLPRQHRLSPADALASLAGSLGKAKTAVLPAAETWALLRGLAAEGHGGGLTYDAAILAAARFAGAQRFLTLNQGDFERLDPEGIAIAEP